MKKHIKEFLVCICLAILSACGGGGHTQVAPEEISELAFTFTPDKYQNQDFEYQVGQTIVVTFYKDGTYKLFFQNGHPLAESERKKTGNFESETGHYKYNKKGKSSAEIYWMNGDHQFLSTITFTSNGEGTFENFEIMPNKTAIVSGTIRYYTSKSSEV